MEIPERQVSPKPLTPEWERKKADAMVNDLRKLLETMSPEDAADLRKRLKDLAE